MRKVIVCNIMSVDGFYTGPDGNIMALNMDSAFDAYNLERIKSAGTVLLGRTSFEMFSSYWPGIAAAPQDESNRALSQDNREFSRIYNSLPKAVISDTLQVADDNAWYASTTVIPREDTASWLRDERTNGDGDGDGDGDIVIYGSHLMWNGLLSRGLLDEIHLLVGPGALCTGTPIFTGPANLSLLESRRFTDSDNVLLRYAAA